MGTRADFYIGRGEKAEWLGSIAYDGYPEGIDKQILQCTGPDAFRHAVAQFIKDSSSGTTPEQGWPWPWETSSTSDYAYAHDNERCWASCFGSAWFDPNVERPEDEEEVPGEKAVFPNMKEKQKVTFGKRSGLLVIGG